MHQLLLSIVVPVHNESAGIARFHHELETAVKAAANGQGYEIIYVDDGSTDTTAHHILQLRTHNDSVKLLKLSRNFGKENALSAGLAIASGQAVITLDGDGQHPVTLIPQFVTAWQNGAQVVIGRRTSSGDGLSKRASSWLFHTIFNLISSQPLEAGTTDFRLLDRQVQQAFLQLQEDQRSVRGLIDWLGFERTFIEFAALERRYGTASYTYRGLFKLAMHSLVSLSPRPLYIFGALGMLITLLASLLGAAVVIEQLLLADPWHWHFTGTAMLGILILFLVGLILVSQGLLSLYISHIQNLSKNRPLYVIDYRHSAGVVNDRT